MKTASHNPQQPIARKIGYVALGTAAILLLPLVAMQFTSEVDWKLGDFIVMGALMMAIGSTYVFAARMVKSGQHRVLLGAGLTLLLLIIWAELAVGLIGTPFAGS